MPAFTTVGGITDVAQCGTPADRSVYGDDFYIDTEEIDYCPTCGSRMDLGLNGKVVKK